ncbi:MAG: hypothetical protein P4L51_25420 [Puia sp.]|nr:hypothetical protein [Puia sp.]
MLFIVAGIQLLGLFGIKAAEGPERTLTVGIVVFIALVFAGLGLWTKKKPYAAILTALIFYGALLILDAVFEPASLFSGLLLKIGIIVALISGLRNAKEGEDLKKTFGQDQ